MNKQHSPQSTLREIISTVNLEGIAFITEDEKLVGVITGGDIRRALLEGKNLDSNRYRK